METTISVVITLAYADASDRRFTFRGVDSTALPQIQAKVRALNANMPAAMKETFISESGAECTMISKAQAIESAEEVIYSAS